MVVMDPNELVLANGQILDRPMTHQNGNFQIPNERSITPGYLKFLDIAYVLYKRDLKVSLDDDDYVGETGIHASHESMRTPPGYGMKQVTYLPVDNAAKCSELGLPSTWLRERDRQIYRELFRKVLSSWHVIDLKVAKNSKSGLPWLEYEVEKKIGMIRTILANERNFNIVLDGVLKKSLERLFKDLRYVIAFVHNVRWQVDKIGKQRMIADLEYALSGGKRGKLYPSDKRVVIGGVEYPEFSACRLRLIQGLSLLPAAMEQIKFSGHMKHMFVRYPKTWHHRDVNEILSRLKTDEEIEAGDVSDYDSTAHWFMFEEFLSVMAEFYSPGEVEHTRMSLQAPYVTPPVEQGGTRVWVGNPTIAADFKLRAGIRSGHPSVSCLGKLFKTAETLCIFDRMNHDVLEKMDEYLDWKRDLKIANSGDDEWDIMPIHRLKEYSVLRYGVDGKGTGHSGYFKVEREVGKGLTGKIVTRRNKDNRTRRAIPKISSRFQKTYQNERGVDSLLRKRWPIGYYARRVLYKENPACRVAEQIDDYAWKKSGLEAKHGTVDSIVTREFKMMVAQGGAIPETESDYLVVAQPDLIHYAVDESDLSQGILDSLCTKVKHDEWLSTFSKHYGGIIYG